MLFGLAGSLSLRAVATATAPARGVAAAVSRLAARAAPVAGSAPRTTRPVWRTGDRVYLALRKPAAAAAVAEDLREGLSAIAGVRAGAVNAELHTAVVWLEAGATASDGDLAGVVDKSKRGTG